MPESRVACLTLPQHEARFAFLHVVEEYREEFDDIWYYGYANPELVPERLCPH